jgi:predicted type IV restriction endonuclease
MDMTEQLLAFVTGLRSDRERILSFDEASTKQEIIQRFLFLLGWNIFNSDEVHPEYSVGILSVDYSLRIDNANRVFLEVKRVREDLENHQEQLLNHSFEQGVKLAVLTNGVTIQTKPSDFAVV